MNITTTEEKLKERVKELACLYEISKTLSRSNHIEKTILKKLILSTKKAWRFNKDAIAEIAIENHYLSTSKITLDTVYQMSVIKIGKRTAGFIKVHYLKSKHTQNDFLRDEQQLLNAIAIEIANYIERSQNLAKELQLKRSAERMDRLSILGEMTAGIAHDLNTPLGNILGFAELIKSNNTNPEIDSDISIVINSVIYSREIVKKLMFFSCEVPQKLETVEIKPIVTFVLSFLKQNFQKKEIKSELIFTNQNLIAKIDAVQITQILFNLLINAIYASPDKSTIRTIVENDSKNIIIKIEDQGSGIPDDYKEKIFEPFFSTKPLTDGSGLGLSVVRGIIRSHNGKIIVKDNRPNGTIFKIKLPIN
ncbi:sensor histidine kinase [Flavobacterium pectinovorum]|jgi:two-component system NtrC family sensor kinase|uniref:histidine kinase n=1 Tax=Flavobacterium pectinovorum TaxID=29533 RepID=A0A502EPU3_9FLAO|nr:ATP-binding protein [Flavobacterium pectinovorum]TPG38516.1 GHKL domain-containing protein [Flavobacterium pectinovorum]